MTTAGSTGSSDPATVGATAERILRAVGVQLRCGAVLLLSIGAAEGSALARRQEWYLGAAAVTATLSLAVAVPAAVRQRPAPRWLLAGEFAWVVGTVVVVEAWLPVDERAGHWAAWPTVALITVIWALALESSPGWLAVAVVVGIAAQVYASIGRPPGEAPRLLVILAVLLAAPPVIAGLARRTREVSRETDDTLAMARATATAAERDRQRLLLHDSAGILRLLFDPAIEPALRRNVRRQADEEARRIAQYLERPESGRDSPLALVVQRAAGRFGDLPLRLVAPEPGPVLPAEAVLVLERAITALLHNVRLHANAAEVVITVVVTPTGGWQVHVRDDGDGFDPDLTAPGFGLSTQVAASLAGLGVATTVRSTPGRGTLVRLVRSP